MFQLLVVFNNKITAHEYLPQRRDISVFVLNSGKQTATRLGTANYDSAAVISQSDELVHHRVECLLPQTFN